MLKAEDRPISSGHCRSRWGSESLVQLVIADRVAHPVRDDEALQAIDQR
jgi:hypothetical protein